MAGRHGRIAGAVMDGWVVSSVDLHLALPPRARCVAVQALFARHFPRVNVRGLTEFLFVQLPYACTVTSVRVYGDYRTCVRQ